MKYKDMINISTILENMNINIHKVEISKVTDDKGNIKFKNKIKIIFNLLYDYSNNENELFPLLEKILPITIIDKEKDIRGAYFILEDKKIYITNASSYLFNLKWAPKLRDLYLKVVEC